MVLPPDEYKSNVPTVNWNSFTCRVFEKLLMWDGRRRSRTQKYYIFVDTHEWWQTTQDHLLQRTATRNSLLWWTKETFQGLSEGQFEEVQAILSQMNWRPGGRQIWVALTLQRLSPTVWSQSGSVFGSKES